MKLFTLAAALLALVVLLGGAPTPLPAAETPKAEILALTGVTVIDGTGAAPVLDAVVVIRDGRIAAIGKRAHVAIPEGARVENLPGRWVIPGLFDLHAHVTFLNHDKNSAYDPETSARVLRMLLDFGITTVRNPTAPLPAGVELRDAVAAGKLPGPRIFTTGECLSPRPLPGAPTVVVKTEEEVRREVRRQADAGVDAIKIYSTLPPELTKVAIEEAHARKLQAIGHLGRTTWTEAARAGIDMIEHGAPWTADWLAPEHREAYEKAIDEQGGMKARILWLERLDPDGPQVAQALAELARHGVTVDPTLIAYETKFKGNDPRYLQSPDLALAPAPMLKDWRSGTFVDDWTPEDFRRGAAVWPKMIRLLKVYHERGIRLVSGSDLPNPWVVPGAGLHRELELLADAGLPPLEVLRIATHNGAQALGILKDVGTLEPGKRADLIVLSASPLEDIRNTRKIEQVLKDGRRVAAKKEGGSR